MRRFIVRGLALAMPLALIGSLALSTQSMAVTATDSATGPSLIEETKPLDTAYGCCWIYIFGRWICVPC